MSNPVMLITEDNDSVRGSLCEWLREVFTGYEVLEAATGEEALIIVRSKTPRVVIMDISLPTMNGIEATRQIKASIPATQVVILTVHEEKAFRNDAAAAGASAFVPKRTMQKELLPALRAILNTEDNTTA